jgi:hypothetical protein
MMLRDITSGNNDTDGMLNGQFQAGLGWDACTGSGTPDGGKLLKALKAQLTPNLYHPAPTLTRPPCGGGK